MFIAPGVLAFLALGAKCPFLAHRFTCAPTERFSLEAGEQEKCDGERTSAETNKDSHGSMPSG